MRICDSLVPYLLACLLANSDIISSGEYRIKEKEIPSFLHYGNNDAVDEIFPEDISINTSMSRVTGTLLYSLDKNMNQLIVSLRDAFPHIIDIELNKQEFSVSLSSLCGCERCRYELLELRIQLNHYINIQCNGGTIQKVLKQNGKELNDAYPIWQLDNISKATPSYNNTICLVNTPDYNNIYNNIENTIFPNKYQMSGCIFKVLYNEQTITFTKVTPNIVQKCNKTCTDTICNGGQCYESYSDVPICNCTATFLNGRFCNDDIKKQNLRTNNQTWQIDMFKVSWKSSVDEIFEIKNQNIRIILGYEKNDSSLYILYKRTQIKRTNNRVILTENYVPNTEYVCIVNFLDRYIDVRLLSNGSWSNAMVPVNGDLRKEMFDNITLRSGDDGYIDMVYKDEQEYKWRKLYIGNYVNLESERKYDPNLNIKDAKTQGPNSADRDRIPVIIIAVIAIFVVLSVVLGTVLIIVCLRRNRQI